MFDCAPGFLEHDLAEAGIIGRGGAVGDCEVAAGDVAVEEDGDVVDLTWAVGGIWRQGETAVG